MRRGHFAALQPICPRCRLAGRTAALRIDAAFQEEPGGDILTGILHCDAPDCRLEFPVIDGIPVIVPDVAGYLASSAGQILRRRDLPEALTTLIGDALGPASEYDTTRQQLSIYCAAHYADVTGSPGEGNLIAAFGPALGRVPRAPMAVDLGCAVGGTTFALAARSGGLTLGVDLNFAMLQVAREALVTGRVRYAERRVGLVYGNRDIAIRNHAAVDFWACDLLALPFGDGRFQAALALNVLDCVGAPGQLLDEIGRLLAPSGLAILASPYDWSASATSPAAWIGGHSQRAPTGGSSSGIVRGLIGGEKAPGGTAALRLECDLGDVTWRLRLHDRAAIQYASDVLLVRRS